MIYIGNKPGEENELNVCVNDERSKWIEKRV